MSQLAVSTRRNFRAGHRVEWPPERLQALRGLFDEGLSHLLIARSMGVDKGVVSAKLARLGWRRAATTDSVPAYRTSTLAIRAMLADTLGNGVRLEDLGERECHWPTFKDAAGHQLFCAHAKMPGSVYCEGHAPRGSRKPRQYEDERLEQIAEHYSLDGKIPNRFVCEG